MTNTLTVAAALTTLVLYGVSFTGLDLPDLVQGAIYTLITYVVGGFKNLSSDGKHEA
ncbi:Holin [Glutamicibacter phage Voltaire]|uniref:Holin n=1 Tax=Glutamicibacter phage Voltaire TaxID=2891955 RepID=UPI00205DE728|nr:Holin [Glutamicibacter phage Voltaire]CAH1191528.1 Holin [Glutamicibacter phage Voltaire]